MKSVGDIDIKNGTQCSEEPLPFGELLKVDNASFRFGSLILATIAVSPHSVTRGIGAFSHQELVETQALMWFRAGKDGKDLAAADALASYWFKPFDTADAAKLGNTASGITVKEVKVGMSFVEVESALGVPVTRVDLGAKVLYKYQDMTVEFRDGMVANVR